MFEHAVCAIVCLTAEHFVAVEAEAVVETLWLSANGGDGTLTEVLELIHLSFRNSPVGVNRDGLIMHGHFSQFTRASLILTQQTADRDATSGHSREGAFFESPAIRWPRSTDVRGDYTARWIPEASTFRSSQSVSHSNSRRTSRLHREIVKPAWYRSYVWPRKGSLLGQPHTGDRAGGFP